MNFFIVYELDTWSRDLNSDFTLKDCLFGGVKLVKENADPDKYIYVYGIYWDKNVIIFGVDMSSSVHIDNKTKYLNYW